MARLPDLIDLLFLIDAELAGTAVDQEKKTANNGQNLEEIVLGEVLVWVVLVESPKVVDKQVEDAQNDNQQGSAELGLESNNDHDTGTSSQKRDKHTPDGPLSSEDKPDEQEDEKDTASQLEVHLAILFVELGKPSKGLGLAHPRIRQNHEQPTDDGQVAKEEIEVED